MIFFCASSDCCRETCGSTVHDSSGLRDAADQIATDRLPVFQSKDTDRMCGRRVTGVRLAVL